MKLKWFAIGVALTAFFGDWLRMRVQWDAMAAESTRSMAVITRVQATNYDCLVSLASDRAIIESWVERSKIMTLAKAEALQTLKLSEEGDANANFQLKEMGFYITKPSNRLMALVSNGHGAGGY